VTYVYIADANVETVTVNYVDENGKPVASSVELSGKYNETYSTKPVAVNGYTLSATPANAEGKYTESTPAVKYVYKENVTSGSSISNVGGDVSSVISSGAELTSENKTKLNSLIATNNVNIRDEHFLSKNFINEKNRGNGKITLPQTNETQKSNESITFGFIIISGLLALFGFKVRKHD